MRSCALPHVVYAYHNSRTSSSRARRSALTALTALTAPTALTALRCALLYQIIQPGRCVFAFGGWALGRSFHLLQELFNLQLELELD